MPVLDFGRGEKKQTRNEKCALKPFRLCFHEVHTSSEISQPSCRLSLCIFFVFFLICGLFFFVLVFVWCLLMFFLLFVASFFPLFFLYVAYFQPWACQPFPLLSSPCTAAARTRYLKKQTKNPRKSLTLMLDSKRLQSSLNHLLNKANPQSTVSLHRLYVPASSMPRTVLALPAWCWTTGRTRPIRLLLLPQPLA